MSINNEQEKNCAECNQPITFEDFCRINPSFSLERDKTFGTIHSSRYFVLNVILIHTILLLATFKVSL